MRHNKMKTWSLEIWKVDNKNHLVLLTTSSPEQFYICHSIHSISETSQGASGIKAYCPSWNILHRLMTEYCIISHSFLPESRLCTYHILLPPAKPMQSDDIVQHLMHGMLAHLRASSKIAKPRTAYDVRTVNQTPPKAAAVVMLLIHRGGAALVWAVAGTGCGGLTSLITCGPGTRGLGSLADN